MEYEYTERIEPDQSQWKSYIGDHLNRYRFASKFVAGQRVLDAGCGVGYGTRVLLDGGASEVVAVDISDKAIASAKKFFPDPRVSFLRENCETLKSIEGPFGTIVALETMEHFHDIRAFLRQVVRLLSPKGLFICSSPNALVTASDKDGRPANPFHVKEYTPVDFRDLLSEHFKCVELTGQHPTAAFMLSNSMRVMWSNPFMRIGRLIQRATGYRVPHQIPPPVATEGDYVITEGNLDSAYVLLAVCRQLCIGLQVEPKSSPR